jgi:hypothetical protein
MQTSSPHSKPADNDLEKGAVEGDRPNDQQHYNTNAPALDENGLPDDRVAIAEDVVGANADKTQG